MRGNVPGSWESSSLEINSSALLWSLFCSRSETDQIKNVLEAQQVVPIPLTNNVKFVAGKCENEVLNERTEHLALIYFYSINSKPAEHK